MPGVSIVAPKYRSRRGVGGKHQALPYQLAVEGGASNGRDTQGREYAAPVRGEVIGICENGYWLVLMYEGARHIGIAEIGLLVCNHARSVIYGYAGAG